MKKIVAIIVLIIFSPALSVAGDKLIVSGHQEYAPFMWKEGDKIVGASIDALGMIFDELGIRFESRYVGPWKRAFYNLRKGHIDAISAAYITDEREAYAVFTEEFLAEDNTSVFVLKGKEFKFDKWDDLKGKTFGELHGASQGQEFDDWRKKNAKVEYVGDRKLNIRKMEKGRIDCFVTGHYGGLMNIKKLGYEGKVVPLKNPVRKNYLHVAFSKKSEFLKDIPRIDSKIKELREKGIIGALIQKNVSTQVDE